ncbi:MAG: DMT family transporter [Desulfobacterales bacterium]|nr:DMT family transporter [Desulfobacterales bacterium]
MIKAHKTDKRQIHAELILISVTVFWGATFPIVKDAISEIPVLAFLWIRFAIAAVMLAGLAGKKGFATLDSRGWCVGIILGTLLAFSYIFQTFGLERTSAANAGFLTGLGVIWVPLLAGPLLKKRAAFGSKIGAGLALLGLFLLTWHTPWTINFGDFLVVVCSIFIALHILGLDGLTKGYDGRALTFVQITTAASIYLIGSLIFEPISWPQVWTMSLVNAFIITSLFATVYAFWAMTTFQNRTTPTRAALIYTLEPLFAAIFSIWLAGDRLTATGWIGGGFIVIGMIFAEAWPVFSSKKRQSVDNL